MTQWINERMNKDNFWNLMFWVGMVLNMVLVDVFSNFIPILSLILAISALTFTPVFLARFNKVTFTNDKIFLNKQGNSLKQRYPRHFMIILFSTIPVSVLSFFGVDKNFEYLSNLMSVYTVIALILPILYFVFINCPISILFNKNVWNEEVIGIVPSSEAYRHRTSKIPQPYKPPLSSSLITNPSYSGWSGNIYNSDYHKK